MNRVCVRVCVFSVLLFGAVGLAGAGPVQRCADGSVSDRCVAVKGNPVMLGAGPAQASGNGVTYSAPSSAPARKSGLRFTRVRRDDKAVADENARERSRGLRR